MSHSRPLFAYDMLDCCGHARSRRRASARRDEALVVFLFSVCYPTFTPSPFRRMFQDPTAERVTMSKMFYPKWWLEVTGFFYATEVCADVPT